MAAGDGHIAQLNVGRLVAPTDDPRVATFMDNLDRINSLGKRAPGFVWIMENETAPALGNTGTAIENDPRFIANLTVWQSVAHLHDFVFKTLHRQFFARRSDWFEPARQAHFVMWQVAAGHLPEMAEALERLEHLRAHGDSDHAFGWQWHQAKSGEPTG